MEINGIEIDIDKITYKTILYEGKYENFKYVEDLDTFDVHVYSVINFDLTDFYIYFINNNIKSIINDIIYKIDNININSFGNYKDYFLYAQDNHLIFNYILTVTNNSNNDITDGDIYDIVYKIQNNVIKNIRLRDFNHAVCAIKKAYWNIEEIDDCGGYRYDYKNIKTNLLYNINAQATNQDVDINLYLQNIVPDEDRANIKNLILEDIKTAVNKFAILFGNNRLIVTDNSLNGYKENTNTNYHISFSRQIQDLIKGGDLYAHEDIVASIQSLKSCIEDLEDEIIAYFKLED